MIYVFLGLSLILGSLLTTLFSERTEYDLVFSIIQLLCGTILVVVFGRC